VKVFIIKSLDVYFYLVFCYFLSSGFKIILSTLPNVVAEWFILLLRIREILGSNPGPDTGYPE
jgi:hypothetical protein